LLVKGTFNQDEAVMRWESIMQKNAEISGSYNFNTYFSLYKSYLSLIAKHVQVRALLWTIAHIMDHDMIRQVREAGYKIDCSSSAAYAKSITRAFKQSDNLVTKYTSKQKEIEALVGKDDSSQNQESETFEDVWAALSLAVSPMIINDDIRLSQYNAIKKQVQRRNELSKQKQKQTGR
jgi:hypothetical protein